MPYITMLSNIAKVRILSNGIVAPPPARAHPLTQIRAAKISVSVRAGPLTVRPALSYVKRDTIILYFDENDVTTSLLILFFFLLNHSRFCWLFDYFQLLLVC